MEPQKIIHLDMVPKDLLFIAVGLNSRCFCIVG